MVPRPSPAGPATDPASRHCDVSVVIPCLNEAATVGRCVQKALQWFQVAGVQGEVIVVDNGSDDGSAAVAAEAGATVLFESRLGYGYAYQRGLAAARGDYIVMGDADDTYDFREIPALLAPLRHGYDLVIGNRFSGGIQPGAMPWLHRYVGTPIITALVRLFSKITVGDSQSGMRAFTREAYQRIQPRSGGMEFASEMIVKAARLGLRVTEVPITYHPREGESKLRTFRDGWRHLRYLLLHTPGYTFTVTGAVLLLLGALALASQLVGSSQGLHIGSLQWQPVFLSTILLVIGANAVVLGTTAKLYAVRHGIIPEDWEVRFVRRWLNLEVLLASGAGLLLAGLLIDGYIFYQWATLGAEAPNRIGLASAAQALIITGANVAFSSFLISLIDAD